MSPTVNKLLRVAGRTLNFNRYFQLCIWWLVGSLLVAGLLMLGFRWRQIEFATITILGSAAGFALLAAAVHAWLARLNASETAAIVDDTFELKDRISTILHLKPADRETPAGRALADEVEQISAGIHLPEKLPLHWPKRTWLPILPFALAIGSSFVAPPTTPQVAADLPTEKERETAAQSAKALAKKVADVQKKSSATNPEQKEELKQLTTKIEEIAKDLGQKNSLTPHDAALKLADLAKSLEAKKQRYQSLDKMKAALAKLPNLKNGPANEFASAMKQGDFAGAKKQLEKLRQEISGNKLAAGRKTELAEQLHKIQDQLKQQANLEKREAELRKNITDPQQLAKELAKLEQEKKQLAQLQKLAEKLKESAELAKANRDSSGKKGAEKEMSASDMKKLEDALKQAEDVLNQMANDASAKEVLNQMVEELGEARQSMLDNRMVDRTMQSSSGGRGQGMGARSESPDETKGRLTKAKIEQNKGKVFITGLGDGKNFKGSSQANLKSMAIEAATAAEDSVTRQKIPAEYKKHVQDYFENLKKGL